MGARCPRLALTFSSKLSYTMKRHLPTYQQTCGSGSASGSTLAADADADARRTFKYRTFIPTEAPPIQDFDFLHSNRVLSQSTTAIAANTTLLPWDLTLYHAEWPRGFISEDDDTSTSSIPPLQGHTLSDPLYNSTTALLQGQYDVHAPQLANGAAVHLEPPCVSPTTTTLPAAFQFQHCESPSVADFFSKEGRSRPSLPTITHSILHDQIPPAFPHPPVPLDHCQVPWPQEQTTILSQIQANSPRTDPLVSYYPKHHPLQDSPDTHDYMSISGDQQSSAICISPMTDFLEPYLTAKLSDTSSQEIKKQLDEKSTLTNVTSQGDRAMRIQHRRARGRTLCPDRPGD